MLNCSEVLTQSEYFKYFPVNMSTSSFIRFTAKNLFHIFSKAGVASTLHWGNLEAQHDRSAFCISI